MEAMEGDAEMPKLLMFNISDPKKREEMKVLSLQLNYRCMDVPPEKQGNSLRALLMEMDNGQRGFIPFTEEMLVMNGFPMADLDFFLDELRRTGNSVNLKAVVTETNVSWSALQLHHTLMIEAMTVDATLMRR